MDFNITISLNKDQINQLISLNERFSGRWTGKHLLEHEVVSLISAATSKVFQSFGLLELIDGRYSRSTWFDSIFRQMVTKVEQAIYQVRSSLDASQYSDLGGRSVLDLARFTIPGLTIENARVLLKNSDIHEWASQRILMEYIGSKIEG